MTKKKKYLPLYYKWVKGGKMLPVEWSRCERTIGLCDAFDQDDLFQLMYPTQQDENELIQEGLNTYCWASGTSDYCFHEFTPLRQNIVLLMAALNDEL